INTGYDLVGDSARLTDISRCIFHNRNKRYRGVEDCSVLRSPDLTLVAAVTSEDDMYVFPNIANKPSASHNALKPLQNSAMDKVFEQIYRRHEDLTNARYSCLFTVTQYEGYNKFDLLTKDFESKPSTVSAQYRVVLVLTNKMEGLKIAKLELITYSLPTVGVPRFNMSLLRAWEASRQEVSTVDLTVGDEELKRLCVDYMSYPKPRAPNWKPTQKWFFEDADDMKDEIMHLIRSVTNTRLRLASSGGWTRDVLEIRIHEPIGRRKWPVVYQDPNYHAVWLKDELSRLTG
ncbi:hypothetical protein FOL47_001651, partial [Perkinsus chesapeaki]